MDSVKRDHRVMVWFFAGAEARDDKYNVFTGSFIKMMREIMGENFALIKGVSYKTNMRNVAWALNNSQKPESRPEQSHIISNSFRQLLSNGYTPDTQLIMVASSSGTVVAAQTACYLAEKNREKLVFKKPFHLALGASMVSTGSRLYRQLASYQKKGYIGNLVHDELQDEGDSSNGVGSTTRFYAWMNALGLIMPWFSWKHSGPSFLNTHPEKGHLHRRRSKTVKKALDFINVLLVDKNLAGDFYKERALEVIRRDAIKS